MKLKTILFLLLIGLTFVVQAQVQVPSRIEAENFVASSGVTADPTSDNNGTNELGWLNDGNWMDYDISVSTAGYYKVDFRVANGFSDEAKLTVRNSSGATLAQLNVPRTGGMNSWKTASVAVQLPSGTQRIRVFVDKGIFSLNWLHFNRTVRSLPGHIEAETYDVAAGVNTETTTDTGGGLNVTSTHDGDWLDYIVSTTQQATYNFKFRVASSWGNGALKVKDQAGNLLGEITEIPQTGGWQSWITMTVPVTLPAGEQIIRVYVERGYFNFNWFKVEQGAGSGPVAAVIQFSDLPSKIAGGSSFLLSASSTNTQTPLVFTSSNPQVVSIAQTSNGTMATPLAAGTATITVSQAAGNNYLAAQSVSKVQLVNAPVPPSTAQKIPIDPKRWYVLNNAKYGLEALFDGETQTEVHLGYGMVLDTYDAYYPLKDGESMTLEKIKMFDFQGNFSTNPATLSVITNDWTRIPIATFTGSVYNDWVGPYPDRQISGDAKFNLDAPISNIRYLVLTLQGGMPTELEFYGTHQPGNQSPAPVSRQIKLKDMLGVNGYEWNFEEPNAPWEISETKMGAVKSFAGIRHYMDWQKLESSEGVYSYNPTISGGWNYDAIYERCKAEGIEVLACLKTVPDWMLASYPEADRDAEVVPVRYGMPFDQPSSYIEQAKVAFQYAARYGSNTQVNPALLSVHSTPRWTGDTPNTVKIGMNVIKYIECDNERDKWWKGRKGYQTAREYCANLSAFYDGHKNTMGAGVGVKNADPNMKVVLAGLVAGPEYVRGMVDWCKEFRGYKANGEVDLCWDVINYHIYTDNASSSQSGTSTRGAAPEVTNAGQKADEFIKVSNELCYGMPVWITETGFDINQGSPIHAIAIGAKSVEQTQADWILRMSLHSARHGIQKVFYYQMYDDGNSGAIFSTSGLVNADATRRPAAEFLSQTRRLFGEYTYSGTMNQDPVVDRYELNGNKMYVVFIPDEVNRTQNYTLSLPNYTTARVYRPKLGSADMEETVMTVTNGVLTLAATETPQFILPGAGPNAREASEPKEEVDFLADLVGEDQASEIIVYPNPVVSGNFEIDMDNESGEEVQIRLFDAAKGTLHRTIRVSAGETEISHQVDISQLPKGEYILDIIQQDKRTFKKVLYNP